MNWRDPSPDELDQLRQTLSLAQEEALQNLLGRMGETPVRLRVVEEFDGQINVPVALEVVDGVRFVIDADGGITEYPREI